MRRIHETLAMLAVAMLALALAVAGLSIGIVRAERSVELALFGFAGVTALAATGLVFARLPGEDVAGSTEMSRRQRLHEARLAALSVVLLVCALAAGMTGAVVRSDASTPAAEPHFSIVAIERIQWLGGDPRVLTLGLIGAGIALALAVAAALLFGAGRGKAAAAAAGTAATLGVTAALTVAIHPRLDITPTIKFGGSARVTVRPHVTVRPRVTVRAHCHCERTLPITP